MSLLDDVSIVVTPNGYKAGELYAVIPVPTEGAEEITNGDFATDTDWSGQYSSISSGSLNLVIGDYPYQNTGVAQGTLCKISYEIKSSNDGLLKFAGGGSSFPSTVIDSSVGFHTYYLTTESNNNGRLIFGVSGFNGSIDNVSVKEYTSADMDVTRATAATRVDENGLVNYAEVIGGEEVTDGNFPLPNTNWILGGSGSNIPTIGTNDVAINSVDGNSYIQQSGILTSGKYYKITYDVISASATSNVLKLASSFGISPIDTSVGTHILYGTAVSSNLYFERYTNGVNATITNISVKEVTRDNVPRIDYTGGGCPHILAEPQRTNLVTYSEDFSNASWTKQNATVSSGFTSPDGTLNATEILETAVSGNHGLYDTVSSLSGVTDYSYSMFVKKLNRRYIGLQSFYNVTRGAIAFFDLDTGTLLYEFAAGTDYSVSNSKIEDYGNGWYKISTVFQIPSSTDLYAGFVLADTEWTTGTSYDNPYTGDITKGAYIWGAQLEQGYPTSYIPTSGSTVTRNQDIFTRDGIGSLINSTEGVLFAEVAALGDDGTNRIISISDGTTVSRVSIVLGTANNMIRGMVVSGGTSFDFSTTSYDFLNNNKIAIKYKVNDFALWINGTEVATDSSGNTPTGLNKLSFDFGNGTLNFFGKVKQLQVYDTSLSDTQLAALTS